MVTTSFYDPELSYYENYEQGPFGAFADDEVISIEPATVPTELFGKPVTQPFGIPAGPLLNANYVQAALDKGFSLPIYKTVRSSVRQSHPAPNVLPVAVAGDLTLAQANDGLITQAEYTDPLSITNSFGVPSYDPDSWQPDVAAAVAHARPGQLVGLSFEGTHQSDGQFSSYLADWVTTARLAAETNPAYLEANLSCPNEGTTALLCFDVDRVQQIATAIKAEIGDLPLLLKISYFTDQQLLEQLVAAVGDVVDGFATINTLSAEVRTPAGEQALPGEGRLRSGICGRAIRWAGLEMVERFAALREQHNHSYTIVGVGGVTSAADYDLYRAAGADVVMSATGAMWNPYLAKEIAESATN